MTPQALRERQLADLAGRRPAVVLVDAQVDFADPAAIADWCETPADLAAVGAAVEAMARLVDAARAAGVP
ncbi:MAG: hypothetical protein QM572_00220, partial [Nocardioides sp.]|uniref:hypothetical protein n=1 Tax=Nocardioides sp. TaxID=35761 RepID=UPI0039E36D66